jgi:superoxide dismutase, Cu-Zn family
MMVMAGGVAIAQDDEDEVEVTLRDTDDNEVGTATLTQTDDGVQIVVQIDEGTFEADPAERGIHIHERGVCDVGADPPYSTAGGHFNPTDEAHGGSPNDDNGEAHAGDLGNLTVEEDGSVQFEITTDRVTLESGEENSLDHAEGTSLVIHAEADDLETDPSGESGDRVVCGVIFPPEDDEADEAAANGETEFTVEMVDIDFNPNEFTIPANTDVTVILPNNGEAPHDFVIDELGIQSELAEGGEETSVTINAEPGEYVYYCSVPGHREAGMEGTLIVE